MALLLARSVGEKIVIGEGNEAVTLEFIQLSRGGPKFRLVLPGGEKSIIYSVTMVDSTKQKIQLSFSDDGDRVPVRRAELLDRDQTN
jgi:hypothetical protein